MWSVEGHPQNVVPGRSSVRYHPTDDARSPKTCLTCLSSLKQMTGEPTN